MAIPCGECRAAAKSIADRRAFRDIAFGPAVIYAESLGYICYGSVTFGRGRELDIQELMVRASWLYHVEGLTQAQIGERMSLTRRRVNELLGEALDKGVVRISFSSSLAENVALEARLCSRFGLEEAVVAPTPSDPAHMNAVIGRAAAAFLDRVVRNRKPRAIGVGWGATLHETVLHMTGANEPDMRIRSLMGGLTRGSELRQSAERQVPLFRGTYLCWQRGSA